MGYLAVDLGTTNIKVIAYDADLRPLASESAAVRYEKDGDFVEFDAEAYYGDLLRIIRDCCAKAYGQAPFPVRQIALTGQAETLVVLGKDGKPARSAISWMDMRSREECLELRGAFSAQEGYRKTGQPEMIPTWPVTKILWLRKNEPETFERADKYLLLKDFIQYRLCGVLAGEHTVYNFSHYFDIVGKAYWTDILDYCSVREGQLPPLVQPCALLGPLTPESARATGIDPTARVNAGMLDHFAGMVGTGNIRPGAISESTGTVLALATMVDRPLFTPEMLQLHCGPFDGTYVFLPTCESGGVSLEWFRNTFMEGVAFDDITRVCAQRQRPGALTFLPYLTGANAPDFNLDASGVFFGFKAQSDRYDFALAVMEGVAHMLNDNIRSLAKAGIRTDSVISTGGGAKSALWCQIKADITGYTVKVPDNREAACLGAAIIAAVSDGRFPDYESAVRDCVRIKTEYAPRLHEAYEASGRLYRAVFESLQAPFRAHTAWRSQAE